MGVREGVSATDSSFRIRHLGPKISCKKTTTKSSNLVDFDLRLILSPVCAFGSLLFQ